MAGEVVLGRLLTQKRTQKLAEQDCLAERGCFPFHYYYFKLWRAAYVSKICLKPIKQISHITGRRPARLSGALFLEPSHAGHPKALLQLPLQAVKEVLFVTKRDPVCPFLLSSKSIIISPKGTFCACRRKENRVKKETMVPFTENSCKPEEGEIWG